MKKSWRQVKVYMKKIAAGEGLYEEQGEADGGPSQLHSAQVLVFD